MFVADKLEIGKKMLSDYFAGFGGKTQIPQVVAGLNFVEIVH